MKTNIWIYGLLVLLLVAGCEKEMYDEPYAGQGDVSGQGNNNTYNDQVPEGYFVARFIPSTFSTTTRAAVNGQDSRVQHIRYIVYKSTGEFVKEKVILSTAGPVEWPLPMVKDTLPYGEYKAVFLGNVESTLFPYKTEENGSDRYADVLSNYQTSYSDARITLPPAEFSDNTEYYWANVDFSDTNSNPSVLLQRIIGSVQMKRVLIDGRDALNMLLANVVAQINEGDLIQNTVEGVLTDSLTAVLDRIVGGVIETLTPLNYDIGLVGVLDDLIEEVTGLVDALLNPLVQELLGPVVEILNDLLLQALVDQLASTLDANNDEHGLVAHLGEILNPWNVATARYAVVSIDDYPKAIDFDLDPIETYPDGQKFLYGFNTEDYAAERHITVQTFAGSYHINEIAVAGVGLVSGLVVDGLVDDFLLTGALVDVDDPLQINGSEANRRYLSEYSLASLGTQQDLRDGPGSNLTLTVSIGKIANVDGILGGILGPVLGSVLGLVGDLVILLETTLSWIPIVGNIVEALTDLLGLNDQMLTALKNLDLIITLPINISLLDIDQLSVSGSWGTVEQVENN